MSVEARSGELRHGSSPITIFDAVRQRIRSRVNTPSQTAFDQQLPPEEPLRESPSGITYLKYGRDAQGNDFLLQPAQQPHLLK